MKDMKPFCRLCMLKHMTGLVRLMFNRIMMLQLVFYCCSIYTRRRPENGSTAIVLLF
jgi:hypothetical protein